MREQRRGARAVAHGVARTLGRLPDRLHAEILVSVLELELLRDRHTVVADDRGPHFLAINTDFDRGPSERP